MSYHIAINNLIIIIVEIYLGCYAPVLLAYTLDFLDELVDELQYHAVALLLVALDHYVAAFEQKCYAPKIVRLIGIIQVNKPALQFFFLDLLELGA